MNTYEWAQIAGRIESLWGKSAKWARADDAYATVRDIPADAFTSAVNDAISEGYPHAPSIPELAARARRHAPAAASRGPCTHPRFAILGYHGDGSGADGLCAVCRTGFQWRPGRVWSLGVLEDRQREARERVEVTL